MRRIFLSIPVVFALALSLPSPAAAGKFENVVDPSITDGSAASRLAEARGKWQTSGTVRYRFRMSVSCFCPRRDPVEITVEDGKATVSDPDWFGPRSVPELFDFIGDAIERESARLVVKYRPDNGVPLSVAVDREKYMVDEEIGYTITGFVDLDDPDPPEPPPSGGAANRKQAIAIARKRLKQGPRARSWNRGHGRSIVCRRDRSVFVCRAKWTFKGKARTARILVPRL